MRIHVRWRNVIALALVIIGGVLLSLSGPEIAVFLSTMNDIGPGHSDQEQTMGLFAFGMLILCIVSVVKILAQSNRK